MKRRHETQEEVGSHKKQCVKYTTFKKWQCDLDCEYQTMSWLDCSRETEHGKKVVAQVKYRVCTGLVKKI